jgi:hypothetical protein
MADRHVVDVDLESSRQVGRVEGRDRIGHHQQETSVLVTRVRRDRVESVAISPESATARHRHVNREKRKGDPGAALHACVSTGLCGPGRQFTQIGSSSDSPPVPPPGGGYLQTTRSGAAARPHFESPVRESCSKSSGLAALRPFVSPRRPRRIGALLGCMRTIGQGALVDPSPIYG